MIPEFAVVGHPNEGKSSVLSTLAEDDSVRISPFPGETIVCRSFPVCIDGREIIRFTDTPGFQNPRKTLKLLQSYEVGSGNIFSRFKTEKQDDPSLNDDCELLVPIVNGAGIIYVVDGSRPIRNVDKAEMEILRLTGLPRMAIINSKDDDSHYIDAWKESFRKSFNAIRIFNAHQATYRERIELLEALKHIDQEWYGPLEKVIAAFKTDWQGRNMQVVHVILEMITDCISYTVSCPLSGSRKDAAVLQNEMIGQYAADIRVKELEGHRKIRSLFKHNIFQLELPEQSILHEDLFSDTTWQFLGLNTTQMVLAGGISGAAVGAGLDLAAAGITFGIFSSLGGIVGALSTMMGGKKLLKNSTLFGVPLTEENVQIGPNTNVQFLFVLLDRALLYYSHVINWAHGRRDYLTRTSENNQEAALRVMSRSFSSEQRRICSNFFQKLTSGKRQKEDELEQKFSNLIADQLRNLSHNAGA